MPTQASNLADLSSIGNLEYDLIRKKVYEFSHIELGPNKHTLITTRLARKLKDRGFTSYADYCKLLSTPNLPANLPPTCITLHIPHYFSDHIVKTLNQNSPLDIQFASHNEPLTPGSIRLAPPDQHLTLKKENNQFVTQLSQTPKRSGHRPSVNTLFESAAPFANENTLAAVLTGMGSDGAEGLLKLKNSGAQTIIESQETATIYGMPLAFKKLGAAQHEIPIYELPQTIAHCLNSKQTQTA